MSEDDVKVRAQRAREEAMRLQDDTRRILAESERILRQVLWTCHQREIVASHVVHPEGDHEIVITVLGEDMWTRKFDTAPVALAEARRIQKLLC